MTFLLVPLIVIVVAVLFVTWASGRSHRNPHRSVRSFNRALEAIGPPDDGDRLTTAGRGR